MTLALRAMDRLANWADLSEAAPSCGTGRALRSPQAEIAHFHTDRDVDLHLTTWAIRRFEQDLGSATAVRLVPGAQWVTVRLEVDTDIDLLMTLVSLALRAHQRGPVPRDATPARCTAGPGAPVRHGGGVPVQPGAADRGGLRGRTRSRHP
ncbi:luciferase family protein [Streptomyces sp. NPDC006975]|uniref:luciferase domain-containing protein n=1 Tax=unclassified Streptomyces TaxID=2593676 RepID=UPI003454C467